MDLSLTQVFSNFNLCLDNSPLNKTSTPTTETDLTGVFNYTQSLKVRQTTAFKDRINDPEVHYPGGSGKIAFGFYYYWAYDPTTINFYANQESDSSLTTLSMSSCTNTNFPTDDWASAVDRDITYSYCLDSTNFKLQGDFYSDEYEFLHIYIDPCSVGCWWTNPDSRAYDIDNQVLDIYFLSGYYNFDADPTNPISDRQELIRYETTFGDHCKYNSKYFLNILFFLLFL